MRRVSISLEKGGTHKKVGLAISPGNDDEELRKVITVVEESLKKNFSGVEIAKQKAVRELFGGEK